MASDGHGRNPPYARQSRKSGRIQYLCLEMAQLHHAPTATCLISSGQRNSSYSLLPERQQCPCPSQTLDTSNDIRRTRWTHFKFPTHLQHQHDHHQSRTTSTKMAPSTRRNDALAKKIATLQLRLAPLVPLPSGPPHPAFPKTLMAFHLLTEDELDSIAHYYHQSTPGPWTNHYPAKMNWDKDFLAKPAETVEDKLKHNRRLSQKEQMWLEDLMSTVEDLKKPGAVPSQNEGTAAQGASAKSNDPYAGLSDKDRIRIKRRKVGKFIGLVGMETPIEEMAGRIQASFDRAVERSREELRRNEEIMLRRKKMA